MLDHDFVKKDTNKKAFRGGKTELPFYSWQCLSIQSTDRQFDLVIKNEEHMDILIKFLVFKMNTMDCMKDSAGLHIDASTLYETKFREKRLKK